MVLGKVGKMFSSCNGKVYLVESRYNVKHKALLLAAKSILRAHDKNYKSQAVTFNKLYYTQLYYRSWELHW